MPAAKSACWVRKTRVEAMKQHEIVGIGANVFDTLIRVDTYPDQDTKKKAQSVSESGGGPCGTGLVAAAKLGAACAYIGHCSDDRAGQFLQGDFEARGVDTRYMTPMPDTSAFCSYVLLADDAASRTCVFHRGSVPPTQLGEAEKEAIAQAHVLMVDGNDLDAAVEGARIARENETLVLYDAGGLYEGVERLLALTDILIPSEEFSLKHTGVSTVQQASEELYRRYRPRVVVITQGKQGGWLFDGKRGYSYPAFPVEAVDTNGSGDVFHGAFAFGLTRGYTYDQCCVFASAVSALKCTAVGARKAVPTLEQTMVFLRSQGVETL